MANAAEEFLDQWDIDVEKIKAMVPDTAAGFAGLFGKVMKDGALSVKEKELIALGMAIALRCVPCIRLHVQKCLEAGANKQQVMEVASVAVMMQGGPGLTYIPYVIESLEGANA